MPSSQTPEWTFGDRLKKAREVAGLEQADLARIFGMSAAAISKWERDESQPRHVLDVAHRWAEATGVPIDWLLGIEAKGAYLVSAAA